MQYFTSVTRFGARCPGFAWDWAWDTSPQSIDREGLGESCSGTRQTPLRVPFPTRFSVFGNVVKHGLSSFIYPRKALTVDVLCLFKMVTKSPHVQFFTEPITLNVNRLKCVKNGKGLVQFLDDCHRPKLLLWSVTEKQTTLINQSKLHNKIMQVAWIFLLIGWKSSPFVLICSSLLLLRDFELPDSDSFLFVYLIKKVVLADISDSHTAIM